jgi:hypothetical protein
MPWFKIIKGSADVDGTVVNARKGGQFVESDQPLDELAKGKFERVAGPPADYVAPAKPKATTAAPGIAEQTRDAGDTQQQTQPKPPTHLGVAKESDLRKK